MICIRTSIYVSFAYVQDRYRVTHQVGPSWLTSKLRLPFSYAPYTRVQLLFWCQQEVGTNLMGHPVVMYQNLQGKSVTIIELSPYPTVTAPSPRWATRRKTASCRWGWAPPRTGTRWRGSRSRPRCDPPRRQRLRPCLEFDKLGLENLKSSQNFLNLCLHLPIEVLARTAGEIIRPQIIDILEKEIRDVTTVWLSSHAEVKKCPPKLTFSTLTMSLSIKSL